MGNLIGVVGRRYALRENRDSSITRGHASTLNSFPISSALAPDFTLEFPVDPGDYYGIGPAAVMPVNVIDLEFDPDGQYLYCALGRRGLGILDITRAGEPVLLDIIDTPGTAAGIACREDAYGRRQLVLGDSHAGIRLYGRSGE